MSALELRHLYESPEPRILSSPADSRVRNRQRIQAFQRSARSALREHGVPCGAEGQRVRELGRALQQYYEQAGDLNDFDLSPFVHIDSAEDNAGLEDGVGGESSSSSSCTDSDSDGMTLTTFTDGETNVHDWIASARAELSNPRNKRYLAGAPGSPARKTNEKQLLLSYFDAASLEVLREWEQDALPD